MSKSNSQHVGNSAVVFTSMDEIAKMLNHPLELDWVSVIERYKRAENRMRELSLLAVHYDVSTDDVKKFLIGHGFNDSFLY